MSSSGSKTSAQLPTKQPIVWPCLKSNQWVSASGAAKSTTLPIKHSIPSRKRSVLNNRLPPILALTTQMHTPNPKINPTLVHATRLQLEYLLRYRVPILQYSKMIINQWPEPEIIEVQVPVERRVEKIVVKEQTIYQPSKDLAQENSFKEEIQRR